MLTFLPVHQMSAATIFNQIVFSGAYTFEFKKNTRKRGRVMRNQLIQLGKTLRRVVLSKCNQYEIADDQFLDRIFLILIL